MPIIIDENRSELLIFSNNKFFSKWKDLNESFFLLDYILPTEDLEDLNLIKSKYELVENYNFEEIISKYSLEDSIIALIFKNEKEVRILSKINIQKNIILKNQTFLDIDINDNSQIEKIIFELKVNYEDHWKNLNQINTSIKLPLNIKIDNSDNSEILNFEKILRETDLIYDFFIQTYIGKFFFYLFEFNLFSSIFNFIPYNSNFFFFTKRNNYNISLIKFFNFFRVMDISKRVIKNLR